MAFTDPDATTLGTIVEGIFYGAYMVLFILYLVLRRRDPNRAVFEPLALAQILLFGLCTLFLCFDIPGDYFEVVADAANDDVANKVDLGSSVMFSLIDYVAQMILLYRCWIIWGRRWMVVVIPGFLALVSLGAEFALVGLVNSILLGGDTDKIIGRITPTGIAAFSISLGVNALTTSLIVTRIFLISRGVQPASGSNSRPAFRIVTAMLIESGLLIFVSQLIYVVLFSIRHPAFSFVQGPVTQIYGITPTLLNIRVVMGSAYDKTTGKVSSLNFAHSEGATTQTTSASIGTSGIQTRGINIGLDDVSDSGRTAEKVV